MTLFEREGRKEGKRLIAGVDEAGRGPLAGPVVAAACILEAELFFEGVNDSKLLSEKSRLALFEQITTHSQVIWSYAVVDAEVIDQINIYQATRLAMKQAVERLSMLPDLLLIDAMTIDLPIAQKKIISGDRLSQSIAAASIVAKTIRDRIMCEAHERYPEYGFAQHKGYATALHTERLQKHGPSPLHRKSFAPVKEYSH